MGDRQFNELVDTFRKKWTDGDPVRIEELVSNQSSEYSNENLLDLIYAEVLLREEAGETANENEYTTRFPELADQISRQFQVHRALAASGDQPEANLSTNPGGLGATLAPGDKAALVPRLTGFALQRQLGRGANGVVWLARDEKLNRLVAIKFLVQTAIDDSGRERFLREAETSASLKHKSIVPVYQVGEEQGAPFLVMEYLPGGSLANQLQSSPLKEKPAAELIQSVAEAVQFAHDNGVIHRDIKPGNIMMDAEQQPHVCDFGLARKLDANDTLHATGDVIGTPAYMSPEQAKGESAAERSDVYSLGAVLYESLCGRTPFQAATPWDILHQVMTNDAPPLRRLNPTVSLDLQTICDRCLQKDPARRYESASELAAELQRFRNGEPIVARPISPVKKAFRWAARNPLPALTAGLLVALAVVVPSVLWVSQRQVSQALTDTKDALANAETQRDVALTAMNNLVHQVHDDLQKREASIDARGQVLQSAIAGLETIVKNDGHNEETLDTMLTAHTRYAYILSQQSKFDESRQQHEKAIALSKQLTGKNAPRQQALCVVNLTRLFGRIAKFQEMKEQAELAETVISNSLNLLPGDATLCLYKCQNLCHQCTANSGLGNNAASIETGKTAIEKSEELFADFPDEAGARQVLIDAVLKQADSNWMMGQILAASANSKRGLELLSEQDPESTEDPQLKSRFYTSSSQYGRLLLMQMEYAEARRRIATAVAGFEKMVKLEPGRIGYQMKLSTAYGILASIELGEGKVAASRKAIDRRYELIDGVVKSNPSVYAVQRLAVTQSLAASADLYVREGQVGSAAKTWKAAIDAIQPLEESFPSEVTPMIKFMALSEKVWNDVATQPEGTTPFQKAYRAWKAASENDISVFDKVEQELVAAIEKADDADLKSMLLSALALNYGQRHRVLLAEESRDTAAIDECFEKCCQTIKSVIARPGADPYFYCGLPEFQTVRIQPRFADLFPVP